jgi:hypothetical protein
MFSNVCSCYVTHRKISHQVPHTQQIRLLKRNLLKKTFLVPWKLQTQLHLLRLQFKKKLITAALTVTKQGQIRSKCPLTKSSIQRINAQKEKEGSVVSESKTLTFSHKIDISTNVIPSNSMSAAICSLKKQIKQMTEEQNQVDSLKEWKFQISNS